MQAESNVWAKKLKGLGPLSVDDEQLLDNLIRTPRQFAAHQDIIAEGEVPTHIQVVLTGCICRYKYLPDGRRQIVAFLLPGDLCDLHVFLLKEMDHSIGALVPSTVAQISRDTVMRITYERPQLTRSLWFSTLLDEAILREWLVGLGRRSRAGQRLRHAGHPVGACRYGGPQPGAGEPHPAAAAR